MAFWFPLKKYQKTSGRFNESYIIISVFSYLQDL